MVIWMIKTYQKLIKLKTFQERFQYLKLCSLVGEETFGFDRFINQNFYKSMEWKQLRDQIIVRDNGLDLGCSGFQIYGKIIIHHMNPIAQEDIKKQSDYLLNPDYLISTSLPTHNAIHYGSNDVLDNMPKTRHKYDTCPWCK